MTWPHVRRFLRLGPTARSGRTDQYSSAGVGLQSPVPPRVGRNSSLWSAERNTVTREASPTRLSLSSGFQRNNRWVGQFRRFPGIGSDKESAHETSSDLPDLPIAQYCDTHADPRAGTRVTWDELNVARTCAYNAGDMRRFAHQIDEIAIGPPHILMGPPVRCGLMHCRCGGPVRSVPNALGTGERRPKRTPGSERLTCYVISHIVFCWCR